MTGRVRRADGAAAEAGITEGAAAEVAEAPTAAAGCVFNTDEEMDDPAAGDVFFGPGSVAAVAEVAEVEWARTPAAALGGAGVAGDEAGRPADRSAWRAAARPGCPAGPAVTAGASVSALSAAATPVACGPAREAPSTTAAAPTLAPRRLVGRFRDISFAFANVSWHRWKLLTMRR